MWYLSGKTKVSEKHKKEVCKNSIQTPSEWLSDKALMYIKPYEATFLMSCNIYNHNCQIWDSSPHSEHLNQERVVLKVNMWCALTYTEEISFLYIRNPYTVLSVWT
jgi:hypothetical protein